MKYCRKCETNKDYSEFHKLSKSPDGYKTWCKTCVKKYDTQRYDKNRVYPKKEKNGLIHCRKCEQYLEKSKFWSNLSYCKDCSKIIGHTNNIKRFGISVEEYIDIEKSQNGLCAICNNPEKKKKRLSIDHDHSCCPESYSCGRCIRGLLCSSCNTFLGNAKDDINILQSAINYLQK